MFGHCHACFWACVSLESCLWNLSDGPTSTRRSNKASYLSLEEAQRAQVSEKQEPGIWFRRSHLLPAQRGWTEGCVLVSAASPGLLTMSVWMIFSSPELKALSCILLLSDVPETDLHSVMLREAQRIPNCGSAVVRADFRCGELYLFLDFPQSVLEVWC